MICVNCNESIDDDSLYCDQCGQGIFTCPKCGKLGKGKACTFDGTKLVSAKKLNDDIVMPQTTLQTGNVTAHTSSPSPQILDDSQMPSLHLINSNIDVNIQIESGDIIGRESGRFVDIFGKYDQISGEHLCFKYDHQKGWLVNDLNSSNGTKYNTNPIWDRVPNLNPSQAVLLSDKSFLLISDIEFYIQINNKGKKAKSNKRTMRLN